LALANETRTHRTSAGKRGGVPRIVENEQAFVFGIKGWCSAGQLETAAGAFWFFMGFLVGRRIKLGIFVLDNLNGRS
jgi:hypothetical protein